MNLENHSWRWTNNNFSILGNFKCNQNLTKVEIFKKQLLVKFESSICGQLISRNYSIIK